MLIRSVQPDWCQVLPLQQQSVLLLATRGPDGVSKTHPAKVVHVAYRGTVLVAAKWGRPLRWGERADSFMSLDVIADTAMWQQAVQNFLQTQDSLPHHYIMHLLHGACIVSHKHPLLPFRDAWRLFYSLLVKDLHLGEESLEALDRRLSDWGKMHW